MWPACLSFLQRVSAQKPSSCYPLPLRRKGRVEAKVDQQMKRSPKLILSLLAFICISSGMSLIPIKRWFSLDISRSPFSLTLCHSASERQRAASEVVLRWGEYWPLYQGSDRSLLLATGGDSLLHCNDCGMLNACETLIVFISLYGDGLNPVCYITRAEYALLFLMHLSCLKKSLLLFLYVSLNQFFWLAANFFFPVCF